MELSPRLPTDADEVTVLIRGGTGEGCTDFAFRAEAGVAPLAVSPLPGRVVGDTLLHELHFEVTASRQQVVLHNGDFVFEAEWVGGPDAGEGLRAVTAFPSSLP